MEFRKSQTAIKREILCVIILSLFISAGSFYFFQAKGIAADGVTPLKMAFFSLFLGAIILGSFLAASKKSNRPLLINYQSTNGLIASKAVSVQLNGRISLVVIYPSKGNRVLLRGYEDMNELVKALKDNGISVTEKTGILSLARYSL